MPQSAKAKVGLLRIEAWVVWLLAGTLALTAAWLVADREPTQKEMTFAYRKHLVADSRQNNPEEAVRYLDHLHDFEWIKDRCEKLAVRRYRCHGTLRIKEKPADENARAHDFIYVHDAMGWTFESPPAATKN
jgi:hypothetical protein